MSIDGENTQVSATLGNLKAKLLELFQLDKACLDFGIYRILRARHKEIDEFLEKHLERTVHDALQSYGLVYHEQLNEDLRKAEQAAKYAGIDLDQSPRVTELMEKIKEGDDLEALAGEVYSHLYTFFSRYYQDGDFLNLTRATVKGREKYMIPYNGEEMKLVWANMEQYYIKSSELLRDYTFQVSLGAGPQFHSSAVGGVKDGKASDTPRSILTSMETCTVHFKLVDGDTEKDNRKLIGKIVRAISLDKECPFEEDETGSLTIRFCYREHASERNLQENLNVESEKFLQKKLPSKWKTVLFTPDPTYFGNDRKDMPTIFRKHLRAYTAKYQFDYFIHKDLGGFLRRELDFYIKNEVMYLDDIDGATAPKAEQYLSKIIAIRRCALPIIRMLEQLENFQRKLWLKKKFVVETRYCITLDRVPEELYPEILNNAAQREEWIRHYGIDQIKPDKDHPGYSIPLTIEFLKANPYMVLDTGNFSMEFMFRILSSIQNIEESIDGICFQSDNYQALQLMKERFHEQIKCIYIDPPYNTGSDGFLYKDRYQHSAYASMMMDRLSVARNLMDDAAGMFVSINEIELSTLRSILSEQLYPVNIVTVKTKIAGVSGSHHGKSLRNATEYLLIYAKKPESFIFTDKVYDTQELFEYINEMVDSNKSWKYTSVLVTIDNGKYVKSITDGSGNEIRVFEHRNVVIQSINRIAEEFFNGDLKKAYYENIDRVFRTTNAQSSIRSRVCEETSDILSDIISIEYIPRSGRNAGKVTRLYYKDEARNLITFLRDTVIVDGDNIFKKVNSGTLWSEIKYNNLALEGGVSFHNGKKPLALVKKIIDLIIEDDGIILDYFAGSGTTGHATINLNREDGGKRKYILVEMGDYFESSLIRRLKNVVYSADWKDGIPQTRDTGISHTFKIIRLEGYEDALNNLVLKRTPEQEAALRRAPEEFRSEYLLSYFLDIESTGSASLLDFEKFRDPFSYSLKIAKDSAGETVETTVDLVETFNWLLGLKVESIHFKPICEVYEESMVMGSDNGCCGTGVSGDALRGFVTVVGDKRAGGRTLIIWRALSDDPIQDQRILQNFLADIHVDLTNTDFDHVYINGSHGVLDPYNKVHLIEEAFRRLMFDTNDFGIGV